jgi:ABC-type sugar transport system substrate-binding protein
MIRAGALVITAIMALGLAGCGLDDDVGAASTYRIAFLLPESKTARYESHDRPAFVERVNELCPECETLVSNAGQDAARQQAQAEAALTNGADVLVLDPVDVRSDIPRPLNFRGRPQGAVSLPLQRELDGYAFTRMRRRWGDPPLESEG